MRSPTTLHWLRLKRVGRYITRYPKVTYLYSYQSVPTRLGVYCDAGWATCKATRRSISARCIKRGKHLLDSSCAKQPLTALSSGESEFYALVRGAGCGLQASQI